MKHLKILCVYGALSLSFLASASGMEDDPILSVVKIDQFEKRYTSGNDIFAWDADAWIGRDLNKLWIKTEGERVSGETESAEVQLLYSKATTSFWDVQFGVKYDFSPRPARNWAVVAAQGVAPYLFDVEASLFIGTSGRTALRLEAEYEYPLSQKLVLSPEIEINVFGKDDEAVGIGTGLSDIELGLRLRYEVKREFAPYVGINWERKYGNTADFARNEGEDTEDAQWVSGVQFWF